MMKHQAFSKLGILIKSQSRGIVERAQLLCLAFRFVEGGVTIFGPSQTALYPIGVAGGGPSKKSPISNLLEGG